MVPVFKKRITLCQDMGECMNDNVLANTSTVGHSTDMILSL